MLLSQTQIGKVYKAALDLKFNEQRSALLSGLPPSILAAMSTTNIGTAQLLTDLNFLNRLDSSQSGYLESWLQYAIALSSHDPTGQQVFQDSLRELDTVPLDTATGETPHAAIVLDRIHQWTPLLEACEKQKEHLAFLVHGSPEQAIGLFVRRMKSYLGEACKHEVVEVQRWRDGSLARTAEDWQRCLLKATRAGTGGLDFALEHHTLDAARAVLFLFVFKDGPLRDMDSSSVDGLGTFFAGGLRNTLVALAQAQPLRYSLRFVVPFEHTERSPDESRKRVAELASKMKWAEPVLRFVELPELVFPLFDEVWRTISAQPRYGDDVTLKAECKRVYDASSGSMRQLGEALHKVLVKWDEQKYYERRSRG